jgi:signal transduction histidine kinase
MIVNVPCIERLQALADRHGGELGQAIHQCLCELRQNLAQQQLETQKIAQAQAEAIVNSALMMAQLEEAQAKLIPAQKEADEMRILAEKANAAKSAFLARMSHEIRTPLNAIIGYSELLQEEAQAFGNSEFLSDLSKIHSAGKHLLALISDILDLSKIEAGMMVLLPETFDIFTLLEELAESIRPYMEQNGNTFTVEITDSLGAMKSDKLRVRQILFNLLSNAGKFTQNSRILLSAKRENRPDEESIIFRVQDWGIGIDPAFIHSLFIEFQQGDAAITYKYGGTGLGLAICKRFCDMMNGNISVQSEPGKGSIFTVQLPAQWIER